RYNAAPGDQGGHGLSAPSIFVMNKFRRRRDFGISPNRPRSVIEIELGHHVCKINVCRPVGIDGPHISPIAALVVAPYAGSTELMCDRAAMLHDVGDDILAEIVARIGIVRIAPQLLEKKLRVEDIDTHTRQRFIRLSRDRWGLGRLLKERLNYIILINVD